MDEEKFSDFITGLPSVSSVDGTEQIYLLKGGLNKRGSLSLTSPAAATYNTRAQAASAPQIPAPILVLSTGGRTTAGDGGGANYYRTAGPLLYPTYGFQSADGSLWEYIPEPDGWNAKVAGVLADGSDDSAHLMAALLPFQNPAIIVGGGNKTGTLLLPPAVMSLHSMVIVTGTTSTSIKIQGFSNSNNGGAVSTCFNWGGSTSGPQQQTMFMLYGCNQSIFSSINFNGQSGGGLINCVHITSDISYQNTLQAPGVPASGVGKTFNVTSNAGLTVGTALGVGAGTVHFEVVYVKTLPGGGTSFTADCVNTHSVGESIGFSSGPTNGETFELCTLAVPPPVVNNRECGILVGNLTTGTPQASQIIVDSSSFVGGAFRNPNGVTISNGASAIVTDTAHGLLEGTAIQFQSGTLNTGLSYYLTYYVRIIDANSYHLSLTLSGAFVSTSSTGSGVQRVSQSYAGFRVNSGGNVKNFYLTNSVFQHCQYGIAMEATSGSVEIFYPTFAGNYIADILAAGASNIKVTSAETESAGQAFLIGGPTGNNAGGATLIQNSYQCGLPADFYVINWSGSLTLINNTFYSQAPVGEPTYQVCPRIKCSAISTARAASALFPSGVVSIGNYFAWSSPSTPIFYDGSNNPMDYGNFSVDREWALFQVNDYGDNGPPEQKIGELSVIRASLSNFNASAGIINNNYGLPAYMQQSYTIPYTAFSAAGTGKLLTLVTIPAHTFITGIVIDITTGFIGAGITTTIAAGTANTTGISFLKTANSSAQIVLGLATGDIGTALAPATDLVAATAPSVSPLGYIYQSSPGVTGYAVWTSGGEAITLSMNSSGGNLNALTQGSMTVYLTYIKYR